MDQSINRYIDLIKPYLPATLIDDTHLGYIRQVAAFFPSQITTFFGFECPLIIDTPKSDFLICIRNKEIGQKLLAGDLHKVQLPQQILDDLIWQRLQDFVRLWRDANSFIADTVFNMWLEFDVDSHPISVPIPSFFMGVKGIPNESHDYQWLHEIAFKSVLGRTLSSGVRDNLEGCFAALPAKAEVFQIGFMLSRGREDVRVCIAQISPENILTYLESIDWLYRDNLEPLITELSALIDQIFLHIDVSDKIAPKIGLECYFEEDNAPQNDPRWQAFLGYLVDKGLCTSGKKEGLLNWAGETVFKEDNETLPEHIRQTFQLLGSRVECRLCRGVHHVKINFQPFVPPQVKVYLSVHYHFLTAKMFEKGSEMVDCSSIDS